MNHLPNHEPNAMPPQFLFFDLGNVLLKFCRERQFRQMSEVLGVPREQIVEIATDHDLMVRYETGQMTSQQVHRTFCDTTGKECDFEELRHAGSDMFWTNAPMIALVSDLARCGYRLGILSNTCKSHWEFCRNRFPTLQACSEQVVVSYEVGCMKPDPEIFAAAAQAAAVPPQQIYFTDDREENVAAAREFGMDAELFRTAAECAEQLRQRGVRFNY